MKNIPIERLVMIGFVAAAAALVFLCGIAWHSAVRSGEAFDQITHVQQLSSTVGQVMSSLTRAEIAQRGYLINGTKDYLDGRDDALLDVAGLIDEAGRLVTVPAEQEHLFQLRKLFARRMEMLRHETKTPFANGPAVIAGSASGISVMDQMSHVITRLTGIENSILQQRRSEYASQRRLEFVSFAMLGVLLPLFLFFLLLRVRRAMHVIRGEEEALLRNARLEEASRMKSEFLAQMSHELRTPINAIMGFSELLKDGQLGELTSAQTGYAMDIYSSAEHLLALVNNILDLSKIEAGKMSLEMGPVDISELLENSVSIIKDKVISQHISLRLDIQPGMDNVYVDPTKVRQIVYNLLSNATKFISSGGKIKLRARRVPRSSVGHVFGNRPLRNFPLTDNEFMEFLEISVADNGAGISSDELKQLFQPYSRGGTGRGGTGVWQKPEGTGLGLMLVKRLAELHGGTVALESAAGQGTRFYVWLPLRMDAGTAAAQNELVFLNATSEPAQARRKIRAVTVPEPVAYAGLPPARQARRIRAGMVPELEMAQASSGVEYSLMPH